LTRLQAVGGKPVGGSYEHAFSLPRESGTGVNLLAEIPGGRLRERYIVLSAHYDHVGIRNGSIYNGADDNASGVAAVLAIAERLAKTPLAHSVIIALWDGEEVGLTGAKAFIAAPPVPVASIALNINLDMVGHNDKGELWASGAARTPTLKPVLDSAAAGASVVLRQGHDRPGVPGEADWTNQSDQGPFHNAGVPFVYFGVDDHPDYHKPTDDPETITVAFFGRAVATIEMVLRRLDRVLP
ncbi:MAG: M20/M25/M40 family metallo-hydrolase, partial [Gemmatimonadales bacterium]|nr:M20/M25/M40 family metallo-hydrolase [Gemmatimonadales bacterium]